MRVPPQRNLEYNGESKNAEKMLSCNPNKREIRQASGYVPSKGGICAHCSVNTTANELSKRNMTIIMTQIKSGCEPPPDTHAKVVENNEPANQLGNPGQVEAAPVLCMSIGAGLGIEDFMSGSQLHHHGGQHKNDQQQVNVCDSGKLRNHDSHQGCRKGVFAPSKWVLVSGNVVEVRISKVEAAKVLNARECKENG